MSSGVGRSCGEGRSCFDLGGDRSYCVSKEGPSDYNVSPYSASSVPESAYDHSNPRDGSGAPHSGHSHSSHSGQSHAPHTAPSISPAVSAQLNTTMGQLAQATHTHAQSLIPLAHSTQALTVQTVSFAQQTQQLQGLLTSGRIQEVIAARRSAALAASTVTPPATSQAQLAERERQAYLQAHMLYLNPNGVAQQQQERTRIIERLSTPGAPPPSSAERAAYLQANMPYLNPNGMAQQQQEHARIMERLSTPGAPPFSPAERAAYLQANMPYLDPNSAVQQREEHARIMERLSTPATEQSNATPTSTNLVPMGVNVRDFMDTIAPTNRREFMESEMDPALRDYIERREALERRELERVISESL